MSLTTEQRAKLTTDPTFTRRVGVAFALHAGFLVQRTDEQLAATHAAFTPAGVRQAASAIVRTVERPETRERLAYLVAAVPALVPESDASLASAVELAFPSLIDPGARNA
jgi:hypothetical protein